jgi:ribosomal-protein-alanine N-acetyltransferase
LRPWTGRDQKALYLLWRDPGVRRYLWDDRAISRSRVAQAVRDHFESVIKRCIGFWALHFRNADSLIGFCGFRIERTSEIELLYGLAPAYWGRGLATEAAAAALDYAWKKDFAHIYGYTDPPNERSIAVLKRLGMQQVASPGESLTFVLERPHGWKKA